MARIVLGLGTSHTPQLSTTTDWWEDHAGRDRLNPLLLGRDGNYHTYPELEAVTDWNVAPDRLTPQIWSGIHERAQQAVEKLAGLLQETAPDVVVVIGDDQEEMFVEDCMPTFAVIAGDTVADVPPDEAEKAEMAAGLRAALWAAHSSAGETYTVPAELGQHVLTQLVIAEFDPVAVTRQPYGRTLGHAFTFVRRRMMGEQMIPLLPIAINTYNPPNQPSAHRCLNFGRALRDAIESYPEDLSVAIVASGGLSHFVVDEELDRRVLDALASGDVASLADVPRDYMRSGTSEILNWIAVGGALDGRRMELVDYIPAYRSTAGTGVGMAFGAWT